MKKLRFLATLAIGALLFTSCNKTDYKTFIGTWGVERIEYYNIDYAGNPIAASMETHVYDPNSTDYGIQLIFRENKSGEMRDSAIDSMYVVQNNDTILIPCQDTVMVYPFTYSYDNSDRILYMNMEYQDKIRTYRLQISNLTDDSFLYENEYQKDYVEKAYLKRVSKTPTKSTGRKAVSHPHKPGSFLGGR